MKSWVGAECILIKKFNRLRFKMCMYIIIVDISKYNSCFVLLMILGQDQHIGTKAPPRELILENAVMPPDPGIVRVQVSFIPVTRVFTDVIRYLRVYLYNIGCIRMVCFSTNTVNETRFQV